VSERLLNRFVGGFLSRSKKLSDLFLILNALSVIFATMAFFLLVEYSKNGLFLGYSFLLLNRTPPGGDGVVLPIGLSA